MNDENAKQIRRRLKVPGGFFIVGWIVDLFTLPSQVRAYNQSIQEMRRS